MLGGAGLQLGREVKILERREDLSLLSLYYFKLGFIADPHRQAKSSHTLFLVAPGPAGLARVAVSTWPGALFFQELLVWRCPTPHPWEEQNLPMDQRFLIAVWRSLMVLWSGAAAAAAVFGDLGFGEEEESLILVRNILIASYCFVVVAVRCALASVSWKRVRPLFVAASDILSRWPSRAWREKSPVSAVAVANAS